VEGARKLPPGRAFAPDSRPGADTFPAAQGRKGPLAVNPAVPLPGFRFYRSDFNMDRLPYWRCNDQPDRKGITEMKYIEGL